jgi:uncharacterized coiled-coil protein SlyX
MPQPLDLPAPLAAYLQELESRLAALETPQGFQPAFLTLSTTLNAANAAQNGARAGLAADLKTLVWSDGVHWWRADTGAQIV